MKTRSVVALVGLAISFAVPGSIAQDAMKVIRPDELVWKEHPVFKDAQIVILFGDPTKAETVVQRIKFPPHFNVPLHTHPYSEIVTVLSGTCWNAMGDDTEKGVMLKPGSFFVLPANHTHRVWTTDEGVIIQVTFTGPGGITFINPADDPRKKAQQTNKPDPQLRERLVARIKAHTDALDKNDAAAVAANFTEDGVNVEQDGTTFGREAIQKLWADRFQNVHFSNNLVTVDEDSPHIIGTDGKQMWATGAWSATIKGEKFGPTQIKGYWSVIREGDDWKIRMLTSNVTPAPAAPAASAETK
jgi:quercetin dioxygenase-like cupin family protein/ketosteroid isomerase-like protein